MSAGDVAYANASGPNFMRAKADAKATSRLIVGVVKDNVLSSATATVLVSGRVKVNAIAGITPNRRDPAYLSRVTAGCVSTALDPLVYPRIVGYFDETTVDGNGQIAVVLDFDDKRDDDLEFLVYTETIAVMRTDFSIAVTRANLRSIRFEAAEYNNLGNQCTVAWQGNSFNPGTWYESGGGLAQYHGLGLYAYASDGSYGGGVVRAEQFWVHDTAWYTRASFLGMAGGECLHHCRHSNPGDTYTAIATVTGTGGLTVGCVVNVWVKVRI
jgi:hypothetical protein